MSRMQSFNLRVLKQLLTASSPRMIGFKQNTRIDSFTSPKGAMLRAVFHTSRQKRAARGSVYQSLPKSIQSPLTQQRLRDWSYYTYPPQTQPLRSNIHNGRRKQLRLPLQSNASFPLSEKPKNSSLNRSYSLVTQVSENRTFFTSCINDYILRAFESNSNCTFSELLGKKT